MMKSNIDSSEKNAYFLSLKWSALLLLSLVLIVITLFFYQYHKDALTKGFESKRVFVLERNTAQVQGILNQSSIYLQQTAELILDLGGMETFFNTNDNDGLVNVLDNHWKVLQEKTEIDSVSLIIQGKVLKTWYSDRSVVSENLYEKTSVMLNQLEQNVPTLQLSCFDSCKQYASIPIFSNGKRWGAITVSHSIIKPLLNFSRAVKIDIGILSAEPDERDNKLERWNLNVLGLSNDSQTLAILEHAESKISLQTLISTGGEFQYKNKIYEIKTQALNPNGTAMLVYIEDISEPLALIDRAMLETLVIGIFAVLLSELALLLILWIPLSKLIKTSDVIPLLATSDFKVAREAVASIKKHKNLKNEMDVLGESIVDLSYQLETLEENEEKNVNALANKMSELTIERDFVKRLLDTAPVMIITQNNLGNIILVNKQVEIVTGHSNDYFVGHSFLSLFSDTKNGLEPQIQSNLCDVASGKVRQFKNESCINCRNKRPRDVTWLHSHIENQSDEDAVILSIGLDVTERKSHEKKISWLADHDPLTGLINRRRFNETLHKSLQIASRYKHQVGLLFLDLDDFKDINDTLGHQTGDSLLQAVAECLKQIMRESDYIGRIGGDEFAIILPMTSTSHLVEVASKINKHLYSLRIPVVGINHRTNASIGIAMYPEHGENLTDLIANADLAMYQAKFRGKGRWHVFSTKDNAKEKVEEQLYWHHKIIDAFASDRFELHYQPIMNINSQDISHFEVLIRMREENGKIILPAPFIDIAEKTGLIHDIDHFVLRQSIQKIFNDHKVRHNTMLAVNLSAQSFSDPKLLPLLKTELKTSGINPKTIVFEITEAAALSDISAARQLISAIRKLGCRFALDDFGVGFSSFYYLKELPVDFIKIDGSFIQNLLSSKNDQIVVKAITDIAREFNIQTIAEYVEDEKTLLLLQKLNVDYAQGYHIGRPKLQAA